MDEKRNEIILFENQGVKLEVNLKDETVWLTQEQMSKLFGKAKSTINEHIKNVYKEGELIEKETMTKFGNSEFANKPTNYYNLDILVTFIKVLHGQDIYKSIEEKGANFLYLIVKNHVFADGNKRIAATLFIYFLNFYGILYKNGKQVIDNNTLTALTLLIAESNPKEKEVIIDLVMNFLNNE